MTDFKEDFNTREVDPRLMIRAAVFYYEQLDKHIKNVQHLSEETIKYYVERLLEITLHLEDFANQIYDNLSDEERAILKFAEQQRNKGLYLKENGEPLSKDSIDAINRVIDASTKRYEAIREKAQGKLNQTK